MLKDSISTTLERLLWDNVQDGDRGAERGGRRYETRNRKDSYDLCGCWFFEFEQNYDMIFIWKKLCNTPSSLLVYSLAFTLGNALLQLFKLAISIGWLEAP